MPKPFLTYEAQINKLITDKHLIINDSNKAKQALRDIGYFSLIGGYKTPFINPMTRLYQNNTTFEDVYTLFQFDQSLRSLIFKYLCQVEQKIRQLISYHFCYIHGEQQSSYLNPYNYNYTNKTKTSISRLINILKHQACTCTEHLYILHQRSVYHNVPLWVLINTLTYGQTSHLFKLLPSNIKSAISKNFTSVNERQLESYLKIFTLFRNVCAHNERLYSHRIHNDFPDTALHAKLKIPKQKNHYIYGKHDLFGVVIALRYLLPKESFTEFKQSLQKLIRQCTCHSNQITETKLLSMMGFPTNWATITRYRI